MSQSKLETAFDVLNGPDKNPLWTDKTVGSVIRQGTQLGIQGEVIGETYLVTLRDGQQTSMIVKPTETIEQKLHQVIERFNQAGFLTFKMLAELMTAGGFIWFTIQVIGKLMAWRSPF